MGGTLVPGTRIRIRCGTGLDYPEGTVIAFVGGRGLVGHRVVGRGRSRQGEMHLLARGDASLVCDPPVEPERVLGEVIEWRDGEAWRPLPPAPPNTFCGRSIASGTLLLVRLALAVDARLATRTAVLLNALGQRLSRRASPTATMTVTSAHQLLLALLRRDTTRESFPVFGPEAWNGLLTVAPTDMQPYIAWRLPQLVDRSQLPAGIVGLLDVARRNATVGYLPRQAVLRRLAHALDGARIPFVVLKGAALAHLAYPAPPLRPMGDIDLWTLPEFLDRTAEVLIANGIHYSSRREVRRAAAKPMEQGITRVFEATGTTVVLELHGEVHSMLAVAPAWSGTAWARATLRDLGGISARVPHAEDMLTHLAVHASAHHHFEMGLRPLLDIALWLEREGAACDWPALAARWRREGCFTWCYLTLSLAKELLAAPVPADLLDVVAPPAEFEELLELARAQVLDSASTLPPTLAKLATTATAGGRGRWLLYRLTAWYWQGPPGIRRTPHQVVQDATRRMSSDVRTKLPTYVRGWRDGSLRGDEFRRRQALALGRQQLAELVSQAEKAGR